jgi:hypothetical protein
MHKSPFHGFSAEFAEHKVYNVGESTKHIDWKLYQDRSFVRQTIRGRKPTCAAILLSIIRHRCIILLKENQQFFENKIGFSVLASAVLMNLLKKQRMLLD